MADVYFGEYMRLMSHYLFREAVQIAMERGEDWNPRHLDHTTAWQKDYFDPGHDRFLRRQYFAQTKPAG